MGRVSISITRVFDPSLVTVSMHPWILSSFSVISSAGSSSASMTFRSYWQSISFNSAIDFRDVRLNNDGSGNLVINAYQNGGIAESYVLSNFEDGRLINGFATAMNP